jgi:hypothetical protein
MPIRPLRPSFRPAFESLEERTLLTAGALIPPVSGAALVRSLTSGTPTAADHTYRVTTGTPLIVPTSLGLLTGATNPGGSTLIASVVSSPGHGTLLVRPDGSFVYAPQSGFAGTDTFTYKVSKGALSSSPATVTLRVAAPARVQGVVLNHNAGGQVTSLTVTFTEVVSYDLTSLITSPFSLIRGHGKGLAMPLRVSSSVVNGQTVAVLTVGFPNGGTIPLPHSPYTLTINGAKVSYGIGQFLDGDGNGTRGGNYVLSFSA